MTVPRKLDLYRWIHGNPSFFRTTADEVALVPDEDAVRFGWDHAVTLPDGGGTWSLGADVGQANRGTLRSIWLRRAGSDVRGVTLYADLEPKIPYRGLIVGLLRAQMNAFLARGQEAGVPVARPAWDPTPSPSAP
jgi:hypothetical protein